MKLLLLILIILPAICSAQLVFEVNSPSVESGVFPCMAGAPTDWTNSQNLYQNGNWFSDTLILSDDGMLGSACSPLNNSINSNFALFQRSGCDLGQSLLNAQNAGATGAIVIDSVDGRPLPFGSDLLSDSITIPFVIISQGKGDSLIQRIAENDTIVVSFGDKTGVNTVDVGIYKEFSLWSRYGIFPFGSYELPDDHFGTWVYNHGTTDVDSLQVKLWFYHDPSYPQHNKDSLSPPFDLNAGDSVFVNFDLEYGQANNGYTIHEANPLKYGYEIIGAVDYDSLDNRISMIIYSEDDLISNTFSPSIMNTDFSEVDYFIEGTSAGYDSMGYCLYMPIKLVNSSNAYFCHPTISLANGGWGAEIAATMMDVNISNQQATIDNYYYIGFYYVGDSTDTVYADFGDWTPSGGTLFNQTTDLVIGIQTSLSTKLGFSSDMYHDERIRQGQLPTYFRKNMTNSGGGYDPQYILTPILSLEMSIFSYCYWNEVEEIESAKISLFPNPATNELTISSDKTIKDIALYDLFGKLISTYECENDLETTIRIEDLHKGCYLMEISGGNGRKSIHRFIKE